MKTKFQGWTSLQWWYYVRRAFWILFSWLLISTLFFFYDYFTLLENGVLSSAYDFKQSFTAHLIVAVIAGIAGGTITVNLMDRWLRRHPFLKALTYIVLLYFSTALIVSVVGALYYYSEEFGLAFYDQKVIQEVVRFSGTWFFVKQILVWLFIVIGTLIVLMVNDKYGPGIFPDYLKGRYFRPKNERRIFMFADIKNATGIAEELGEEKYFNFLKDFFRDIAPAIVQTYGEVYQYVGDEVVVSWKMKQGLKKGNAIRCFFEMKAIIKRKRKRYLSKYGHLPEFKAGYHFGNVMVGEIGQIKREIVFSGDVLNTAARIVGQCNEYNVDILASEVFGNVAYQLPKKVKKVPMGDTEIRGKSEEIGLVTYIRN